MTEKSTLAAKLAAASGDDKGIYNNVLDFKIAHWVIAASARIGQVYAELRRPAVHRAHPQQLKTKNEWGMNEREIFCDALVDQAEPIELKAVAGLRAVPEGGHPGVVVQRVVGDVRGGAEPDAAVGVPAGGRGCGRKPDYVSTLMTPAKVVPELSSKSAVGPQAQRVGAQSC